MPILIRPGLIVEQTSPRKAAFIRVPTIVYHARCYKLVASTISLSCLQRRVVENSLDNPKLEDFYRATSRGGVRRRDRREGAKRKLTHPRGHCGSRFATIVVSANRFAVDTSNVDAELGGGVAAPANRPRDSFIRTTCFANLRFVPNLGRMCSVATAIFHLRHPFLETIFFPDRRISKWTMFFLLFLPPSVSVQTLAIVVKEFPKLSIEYSLFLTQKSLEK